MTVISTKSITGVTSITSPQSDDAVTLHTNDTTQRVSVTTGGMNVTGVVTATSFSGSIAATNIDSGTVATARLGSGTANSSSFLRGDQTWASNTSTTINSNAANRVILGSGTADTLNAQSNFTYDGDEVAIYAQTDDTDCILHLVGKTASGGVGQAGRTAIIAESTHNSNGQSSMHLRTRNTSNAQLIAMTLDGNQNVGIGTQLPHNNAGTNVQIHSTNTTSEIRFTNSTTGGGNNGGTIQMGGNTLYISNSENGNTVFENNGGERLRIASDGKVGIGSDNPGGVLDLYHATSNTILNVKSGDAGSVINLIDNATRSSIEQNGTSLKIISDTVGTHANSDIRLQVDGATKAMIDSVGRMLVGTTTPMTTGSNDLRDTIQAVHTAGAQLLLARNDTATITSNRLGEIAVLGNDSNGTYQVGGSIRFEADANHGDNDKPTRIVFKTCADGSATLTERLRIRPSGVDYTLKVKGADQVEGNGCDTWSASMYFSSGTTHTICTFSTGGNDSQAVATMDYAALYSFASNNRYGGQIMAIARKTSSNSSAEATNNIDAAAGGSDSNIKPTFFWDVSTPGAVKLKVTTGTSVQVVGRVQVTYKDSWTLTRNYSAE